MTHSTYYLYGIEPHELMDMPYQVALQFKLDCGSELYNMMYQLPSREQDKDRMFYILKAITHTRELLAELRADLD